MGTPTTRTCCASWTFFRSMGFATSGVVITLIRRNQPSAGAFRRPPGKPRQSKKANLPLTLYRSPAYPDDIARIVSEEGYGHERIRGNERATPSRVWVTAPGPGSGKMATCPVRSCTSSMSAASRPAAPSTRRSPCRNLPLKQPGGTSLRGGPRWTSTDANTIDPFHLEALRPQPRSTTTATWSYSPCLEGHDGAYLGHQPVPMSAHRHGP